MGDVIRGLNDRGVKREDRKVFYEVLVPVMEDFDWDNQDECRGKDPAFDDALSVLHPEWRDD
jgi:hypothetical protein